LFEGIPIVKIGLYPLQGHYPIVNAANYPTMRGLLESVHNAMHGFVNMGSQHTSFRDPFVYLLHSISRVVLAAFSAI
jgi:hypothetical protein